MLARLPTLSDLEPTGCYAEIASSRLVAVSQRRPRTGRWLLDLDDRFRLLPVVALCDLPPPDRTLAMAFSRHVGHRCGMTVVMRR